MNRHPLFAWLSSVVLTLSAMTAAVATAAPTVATAAPTTEAVASHAVQVAATTTSRPDRLRDPRANLTASPDFHDLCATAGPRNGTCIRQALTAINNAHAAEGVRRMILPTNFATLSIPQQTFVVTNLERVDRGMRPISGLTGVLNANAKRAAIVRTDPTLLGAILNLLGVREYASIWAGDFGPLASDYDWMYNDGYSSKGSVNIDCRQPSASGCWGHRHAILGLFSGLSTLVAGSGTSGPSGSSIAEVIVGTIRNVPTLIYSWRDALAHGANGHKITA